MDEIEIRRVFKLTRDEINLAIVSFYTWLEINNYARANKEVYRSMNKTPSFWNINLYGLQSSFFMALGRIFDDGRDSHSIHKFLAACISRHQDFSFESLKERKRKIFKNEERELDEYMKETYQPEVGDFRKLKREVNAHRRNFDEIYKDIRDYVFAHNIANAPRASAELFGNTKISDIEEILAFLYDLQEVISELYHNGIKPELGVKDYDYKKRISVDVKQAMGMLVTDESKA